VWKKLALGALVVAALAALLRIFRPKPDFAAPSGDAEWPPLDLGPDWVESDAEDTCPDGYPVKVKLSSGIFHVPGGLSYDRTKPDRCYATTDAAVRDGFRESQR
jgi:hypothetical protein